MRHSLLVLSSLIAFLVGLSSAQARTFNIVDYGATPNDDTNDTLGILKALDACAKVNGGVVPSANRRSDRTANAKNGAGNEVLSSDRTSSLVQLFSKQRIMLSSFRVSRRSLLGLCARCLLSVV